MHNLKPDSLKHWPKPTPDIQILIRKGAEIALSLSEEWIAQFDVLTMTEEQHTELSQDPVLLAATRRTNRAGIVHWASCNIQRPGEPVPPYLTTDMQMTALELHQRGLSEYLSNSGRALQNMAFRLWMKIAFQLTNDVHLLQDFLELTQLSITSFIEGNIQGMHQWLLQHEPQQLQTDYISKRQLVNALLEGEPLNYSIEKNLGYSFKEKHLSAVIWTTHSHAQLSQLEQVKDLLLQQLQPTTQLSIIAGSATLWLWCNPTQDISHYHLEQQLKAFTHIRIALGSQASHLDGFRQSHFEALTVQRLMTRLPSARQWIAIEQARMIALMTHDLKAAQHFIHHVLGQLIHAEPNLQHSARLYIQYGCNASLAAQHLFVHRNTLLRRLDQINILLPKPLEQNLLDVGIALEVLSWLPSTEHLNA